VKSEDKSQVCFNTLNLNLDEPIKEQTTKFSVVSII